MHVQRPVEKLFDMVVSSLWAPATYAKFLFLAVTSPFWWPLAKVMYHEILPALNAPEDAVQRRRPPGEDPFLNIPLASHRARRAQASAMVRDPLRRAGPAPRDP
jgi:hypothetical protein